MDAHELAEQFLKSVASFQGRSDGKWAFRDFKTSHGIEARSGFLDACSELFVQFVGHPKPVIYQAIREAFRRGGHDCGVQRYGGMVLLNLVPDSYGQVDELIDVIAPVFDLSNGEIPAFLVEQVGFEPLLRKLEVRKQAEKSPDIVTRLDGIAYQARIYQNRKTR